MNIRELFPIKDKFVYFNSASTGPLPKPAYEKIKEMAKYTCFDGEIEYFNTFKPTVESLRKNIAFFFGCKRDEIALCKNTSHGILLSLLSIPFRKTNNIVVQEDAFPAIKIPAIYSGQEIRFCDFSKEPLKNLKKKINKNTKAVIIDWVHFYKGYVLDLKEIGNFCKEKDIYLIVDGIQGAGVVPLTLNKTPVDFFIAHSAKWLLGPQGIGFMYINPETFKKINKKYAGWISLDWKNFSDFDNLPPLRNGAQLFEEGTFNTLGIFGFNESMKIFVKLGKREIYKRIKSFVLYLRKTFKDLKYEVLPEQSTEVSGIISFRPDKPEKMYKKLLENKIVVSFRNGFIRVSPHFFNDKEEIKKFEKIIRD